MITLTHTLIKYSIKNMHQVISVTKFRNWQCRIFFLLICEIDTNNKCIGILIICCLIVNYKWQLIILDLQLPLQSVPITIKIVSLNPAHGEVYWIQHYMIMFVSDLRHVVVFSMYSAGFLHQSSWQPQYNWNIVESGIKHITLTLYLLCIWSCIYRH
jgi:hypothetical protein